MRRFDPKRLVELRERRGFRREDLAVALKKSYSSISMYERGLVVPPPAVVGHLAAVLECTIDDFFTDQPADVASTAS